MAEDAHPFLTSSVPSHSCSYQLADGQLYEGVRLAEDCIELRAAKDRASTCSSILCCLPRSKHQQIPFQQTLGAVKSGDTAVQIWYVAPKTGTKEPNRTEYQLHKTPILRCQTSSDADNFVHNIRSAACPWRTPDKPARLTALVNPISGQGKAVKVFSEVVLPILEQAAGMAVDIIRLQHSKHATEVVQQLDISSTDMLLFVGGDGTLWEGLQGLLSRPDWQRSCQVPIIQVPLGSGNGVATSCGILDPVTAALAICKGRTSPLDVASVLQGSNRYYMVLLFTYGLMSNLDVGTEDLRWMGDTRFTYGAIREILSRKGYACRAAYLPADEHTQQEAPTSGQQEATEEAASSTIPMPILSTLGGIPPAVPSSTSDLPPGWQLLDVQQVQLFALANLPWIARSYNFNPRGAPHQGHFHMIYTTKVMGKLGGLQMLIASEEGKHVEMEDVVCRAFKAMVFEPLQSGTAVMLDGEVVGSERLYMEVHPGLCNVVVAPGWRQQDGGGGNDVV